MPAEMSEVAQAVQAEYLQLLQVYESYNDQSLIIKGWSITVGMAALVAAYARPSDRPGPMLAFVAAASVLPFYLTDALWKALQGGYEHRLLQIEEAVRMGTASVPLQAMTVWNQEFYLGLGEYWAAMTKTTVLLPHIPIFLAGIMLGLLWPPARGHK